MEHTEWTVWNPCGFLTISKPLNLRVGVTEGKNDALHLVTKHESGQGVRKGEGGNSAEATVAVFRVVATCQQSGPADKQKYPAILPSKHK